MTKGLVSRRAWDPVGPETLGRRARKAFSVESSFMGSPCGWHAPRSHAADRGGVITQIESVCRGWRWLAELDIAHCISVTVERARHYGHGASHRPGQEDLSLSDPIDRH